MSKPKIRPEVEQDSIFPPRGPSGSGVARLYLGVDPGVGGGIAVINSSARSTVTKPMVQLPTDADLLQWLRGIMREEAEGFAVIEQQVPRPTRWYDKVRGAWTSSILKSTCLLYADYLRIRMALYAAGIPAEDCPPQRWQKSLDIPPKRDGEGRTSWKNRLKVHAQRLFPRVKVTLATSDALLLAEYGRRRYGGREV